MSGTANDSGPQTGQAELRLATTCREKVIAKVSNQHLIQHITVALYTPKNAAGPLGAKHASKK